MSSRRWCIGVMASLVAASGCTGDNETARTRTTNKPPPTTTATPQHRPLPPPVKVRAQPQGITLADPAFKPLRGARADFGRLHGAVYQIEMPNKWNGRLLLFMHGFEELASEAGVSGPDFRSYLIRQGYAWGASSFSSTSVIPGRAADETAALWDYFARKYGRPSRAYVTGFSMGGTATNIAAERYGNRFDGALGQCGAAGQTPSATIGADFFAAAAYVAGVTQAEFDASTDVGRLIRDRVVPALRDPQKHARFEKIMVYLTGGPRPFDREGIHIEEETNFRRIGWSVTAKIAPNRDTRYRLGPLGFVTSDQFNRAAVRLSVDEQLMRGYVQGSEITGRLQMPLLTLHTTGDGQVPIEQERMLRRRVDSAGKGDLLVQRVLRDPGHCGFTTEEQEAGFNALVAWVEHGVKPKGTDVFADLRKLRGTFELSPRPGTREAGAVPGARDRVVVRGNATVDGAAFDARFLGAVVRRAGLVTPCQYTLPSVANGRYEMTVLADAEASGCGAPGAEILLWTFAGNQQLYSTKTVAWPRTGRATTFDASFSTSAPKGAARPAAEFLGEVYQRDGRRVPHGTRIEAYVGGTRCGIASTRRTGSYSGYLLSVVGPESVAGCKRGATLTFRVDGRRAMETGVNSPGAHGVTLDLTRI